MKHSRCEMLFGGDFLAYRHAKILLLGVGGVGSFCLDCLYRSGVTDITIVDFDRFDESNQNRQIGSDAVGEIKVAVLAERYPGVIPVELKITPEWVEEFDFGPYDLVLDAIDDFRSKIAVIKKCHKKLISSMGSAKKLDPTKIEVRSLWKTEGDKFASKIRTQLKKERFSKQVTVICSTEHAGCREKGSFVGVTGAFGLAMCSQAIRTLIKNNKDTQ